MKSRNGLLLLCLLFAAAFAAAADEARFLTYPDISGEKIIFTYDDDLWLVSTRGGQATRMTSYAGREFGARFSPDGKWIAFAGSYQGEPDVYLMPAEGGTPKRLTYLPGGGTPVGWTPDSRSVVFRSVFGRGPVARDPKLYKVSVEGGVPESLPIERGVQAGFSEDGQRMLYVRKGSPDNYWKRYKGGQYPDIWMADLSSGSFTPVTDYVGRNTYPMWIGNTMYFASDRGSDGITNLYAQDLKSKKVQQITRYADFDVMWPSTDRKLIVFAQDGYLHVLDPKSNTDRKVTVQAATDNWQLQQRWINPSSYIDFMDVGNDGKSVALTARGDAFHLTTGEEETMYRNLSASAGTRERFTQISPDGKRLAFFSDRSGEYQLYVQDLSGGPAAALTQDLNRTVYHLLWSPDGAKILFGDKDFSLFFLDVASKKLTKVDESHYLANDEFTWEISDYSWSPDSRWIAYSFPQENRNNVIFLYDTQQGKRVQVTDDFYSNFNPRWDSEGGYLYSLSNRNFDITMDPFEDNHIVANPTRVMVVQLRKGEKPPFARSDAAGDEKDLTAEGANRFRVDVEGMQGRIYPLPVEPGNYFHLTAGKGYVAWSSVPEFTEDNYEEAYKPGGAPKWTLNIFSMKDEKQQEMGDKISAAQVSVNGEQLIIRKGSEVYITSFKGAYDSKKLGQRIDLSGMTYRVSPREEWHQIFNDTWRWYRDFFYDKNMHGRDWKAMGDKYRAYVNDIRSRDQLNWVLLQMVGELCVSHTYITGGDMAAPATGTPPVYTGLLGADLVPDRKVGLYRFEKIYGPTRYFTDIQTPLSRPDINLKEGDYLIAINGRNVRVPENYFQLLQVAKDDFVTVTVNSEPAEAGARTYRIKPAVSDRQARYARWVSDNVDKVLKASNGDVGYMHITAMGGGGVMEFDKFWRAFKNKKGLLIDVRGNGGGWTEYFMIDKLERQQVAYNTLQGMEPYRYPNSASRAYYAVITNEDNGSDGEAFLEHFRARKLGTIVGVPSWGGLVGIINRQQTLDGGNVEQSNNAFYGREGKWWIENHGGDPDVLQDNDPASVMAGKDLQLEKALEVVLKKIKEQPFVFPPKPPYPKK